MIQQKSKLVLGPWSRFPAAAAATFLIALAGPTGAAITLLGENAPLRAAQAGEQADLAVAPAFLPASSFSSSAAANVTSVQWWGYDLAGLGGPDNFSVRLNGVPLTGGVVATPDLVDIDAGVGVLKYTLTLGSAFALGAGVGSLQVINATDMVEWYWQAATGGPSAAMSLRIFGEPALQPLSTPGGLPLVLLALGLAGYAGLAGRHGRSA